MQHLGTEYVLHSIPSLAQTDVPISITRGYLASCRDIVTAARTIADAITDDIPELYVLGNPPASVVAFASKHPQVDALEVGDGMGRRGWHLNGLSSPKSVHIACTVSSHAFIIRGCRREADYNKKKTCRGLLSRL